MVKRPKCTAKKWSSDDITQPCWYCKSSRTFVEILREMNLLNKIQKPLTIKQKQALEKIPNALDIFK